MICSQASVSAHAQDLLRLPESMTIIKNRTDNLRFSFPLLILDEVHRLEEEIVKFTEMSILKRRWKRYIPDFKILNYGFDDIESWIRFLIELERRMFVLTEDMSEELAAEAKTDTEKLGQAIDNIRSNPNNWIVSEIKEENNEVTKVKLKRLDVSPFCKDVFEKCDKTLMMSATILDKDALCKSLGLAPEEVKFIQVESDFPLQNRRIDPLSLNLFVIVHDFIYLLCTVSNMAGDSYLSFIQKSGYWECYGVLNASRVKFVLPIVYS
jgi:Rad3-related DNA helicase